MATMKGSGKGIQIIVGADYKDKDLKRAMRDLQGLGAQAKRSQTPIQQLSSGLRKSLVPSLAMVGAAAGAMAIKLLVDGVRAAAEEQAAMAKLDQALQNVGASFSTDAIGLYIDSMQRATGVADDQLRPAFTQLLMATRDVSQAQSLLSLALDVSAGTGRDLSSVTMALSKAALGQTTALRRLGVPLSDTAIKSKDLSVISSELSQTFQGQAKRAANTYQGQVARLGVAFSELQEALGTGFLDALHDSNGATADLADSIKSLEPVMTGIGDAAGQQVKGLSDLMEILKLLGDQSDTTTSQTEEFFIGLANSPVFVSPLEFVSQVRNDLEELGVEFTTTAAKNADYQDAIVRSKNAARDSVTVINDLGDAVTTSGADAEEAATKFDLFAAAMAKTDQVVAFRQSVDEVGKAFKRTNTPVNIFGEKGQENFDLLKGLIEQTAGFAESQDTLAGKASIASQGLGTLTAALQNSKMDAATRTLLLEPFQALIDDLREAGVDVTNLQIKLDALKSKTITVTTNYEITGDTKRNLYEAGGGLVNGASYLAGGGRGSDTVPAFLTPGEFVVKAPMVKRWGSALFSQLNAGINPLDGMAPRAGTRGGGFSIGSITVQSAPNEPAEQSLPRALRRMAFLAGV